MRGKTGRPNSWKEKAENHEGGTLARMARKAVYPPRSVQIHGAANGVPPWQILVLSGRPNQYSATSRTRMSVCLQGAVRWIARISCSKSLARFTLILSRLPRSVKLVVYSLAQGSLDVACTRLAGNKAVGGRQHAAHQRLEQAKDRTAQWLNTASGDLRRFLHDPAKFIPVDSISSVLDISYWWSCEARAEGVLAENAHP
jgi:hypothetical protein